MYSKSLNGSTRRAANIHGAMALSLLAFAVCTAGHGENAAAEIPASGHRIVSIDGATTETLFALGAGDWIVGCDDGSTYPKEATKLPGIGTGHQLNAEAILAMKPTLIMGRSRPMSRPGLHILESTGVPVEALSGEAGVKPARERIRAIAWLVGKTEAGEALIASMDKDLETLRKKVETLDGKEKPKVLIVYLRPGTTLLMGDDSSAAEMVRLAGGKNALPGTKGYKTLNAEAVVGAQPDVILTYTSGLETIGGVEALLKQPGISETPAAKHRRVVALDDLMLAGFGPRTGKAALQLHHGLHEAKATYVVDAEGRPSAS